MITGELGVEDIFRRLGARERTLKNGHACYQQGDRCDQDGVLILIVEGIVALLRRSREGRRLISCFAFSGDIIGLEVLSEQPFRKDEAVVRSKTAVVLELDKTEVLYRLHRDSALEGALLEKIWVRTDRQIQKLQIAHGFLMQKLGASLIELSQINNPPGPHSAEALTDSLAEIFAQQLSASLAGLEVEKEAEKRSRSLADELIVRVVSGLTEMEVTELRDADLTRKMMEAMAKGLDIPELEEHIQTLQAVLEEKKRREIPVGPEGFEERVRRVVREELSAQRSPEPTPGPVGKPAAKPVRRPVVKTLKRFDASRVLSGQSIKAILRPGPRRGKKTWLLRALVFFSLRPSRVITKARPQDVDLDSGTINGAPFPKALLPWVQSYWQGVIEEDLLFQTRSGKPYDASLISSVLYNAARNAGLEDVLSTSVWYHSALFWFANHLCPGELAAMASLDRDALSQIYPDLQLEDLDLDSVDSHQARQAYEEAALKLLEGVSAEEDEGEPDEPISAGVSFPEPDDRQVDDEQKQDDSSVDAPAPAEPTKLSELDLSELWKQASKLDDPQSRLVALLAISTGVLPEEVALLERCDVSPPKDPESIYTKGTSETYSRSLPVLAAIRELAGQMRMLPENEGKYLFAEVSDDDVWEILNRAAGEAGLQGKLRPQTIRDTLFGYLARLGWSVPEVAFLSGLEEEEVKEKYFDSQGVPGEVEHPTGDARPTRPSIHPKLEEAFEKLGCD